MRKLRVGMVLKDTAGKPVIGDGQPITVGMSLCQLIERQNPGSVATARTLFDTGVKINECEGEWVSLENAEYNHLEEHFKKFPAFFTTVAYLHIADAFEEADRLYREGQKKAKEKEKK